MKNPAGKSVTAPQQVTKRLGDNLLSNDLSCQDAQLAPVASGDSLANKRTWASDGISDFGERRFDQPGRKRSTGYGHFRRGGKRTWGKLSRPP